MYTLWRYFYWMPALFCSLISTFIIGNLVLRLLLGKWNISGEGTSSLISFMMLFDVPLFIISLGVFIAIFIQRWCKGEKKKTKILLFIGNYGFLLVGVYFLIGGLFFPGG